MWKRTRDSAALAALVAGTTTWSFRREIAMRKALRGAIMGLALAASPAWAATLNIETTLTLDSGGITETSTATLSQDFSRFELLGSTGSFRLGLSTPLRITDPGTDRISLDTTLFWFPSAEFTPVALRARVPLDTIDRYLINDPDEGGRPSVQLILPRPLEWRWLPQPFFQVGDGWDVSAGLIMSFLSASTTLPGSTDFLVDTLRVDYTLSAMPVVPVPAALPLMLSGLVGFGVLARRRRNVA